MIPSQDPANPEGSQSGGQPSADGYLEDLSRANFRPANPDAPEQDNNDELSTYLESPAILTAEKLTRLLRTGTSDGFRELLSLRLMESDHPEQAHLRAVILNHEISIFTDFHQKVEELFQSLASLPQDDVGVAQETVKAFLTISLYDHRSDQRLFAQKLVSYFQQGSQIADAVISLIQNCQTIRAWEALILALANLSLDASRGLEILKRFIPLDPNWRPVPYRWPKQAPDYDQFQWKGIGPGFACQDLVLSEVVMIRELIMRTDLPTQTAEFRALAQLYSLPYHSRHNTTNSLAAGITLMRQEGTSFELQCTRYTSLPNFIVPILYLYCRSDLALISLFDTTYRSERNPRCRDELTLAILSSSRAFSVSDRPNLWQTLRASISRGDECDGLLLAHLLTGIAALQEPEGIEWIDQQAQLEGLSGAVAALNSLNLFYFHCEFKADRSTEKYTGWTGAPWFDATALRRAYHRERFYTPAGGGKNMEILIRALPGLSSAQDWKVARYACWPHAKKSALTPEQYSLWQQEHWYSTARPLLGTSTEPLLLDLRTACESIIRSMAAQYSYMPPLFLQGLSTGDQTVAAEADRWLQDRIDLLNERIHHNRSSALDKLMGALEARTSSASNHRVRSLLRNVVSYLPRDERREVRKKIDTYRGDANEWKSLFSHRQLSVLESQRSPFTNSIEYALADVSAEISGLKASLFTLRYAARLMRSALWPESPVELTNAAMGLAELLKKIGQLKVSQPQLQQLDTICRSYYDRMNPRYIFLLTDHPEIMLNVGRLPVGGRSCQDIGRNGPPTGYLSYFFDWHIKSLLVLDISCAKHPATILKCLTEKEWSAKTLQEIFRTTVLRHVVKLGERLSASPSILVEDVYGETESTETIANLTHQFLSTTFHKSLGFSLHRPGGETWLTIAASRETCGQCEDGDGFLWTSIPGEYEIRTHEISNATELYNSPASLRYGVKRRLMMAPAFHPIEVNSDGRQ